MNMEHKQMSFVSLTGSERTRKLGFERSNRVSKRQSQLHSGEYQRMPELRRSSRRDEGAENLECFAF